ncbi:MAG: response regulator [Bacteroidetes bacterium]|nr:response regulator [Bacteroidota bacterium]MBU1678490.1 response regulator [Bacteroidota bacterium]MBU2506948.1 response regulator [Bacteroidota bacterium]
MHKILIVDDDKDMCKIISTVLMQEGYKIFKAFDGEQAIKAINAKNYNLVILDFRLPNMDGIEVLQKIRNMGLSISVIMISAYGNDLVKSKAKKFGVSQFLDKPFDLSKLIKVVKNTISKN